MPETLRGVVLEFLERELRHDAPDDRRAILEKAEKLIAEQSPAPPVTAPPAAPEAST